MRRNLFCGGRTGGRRFCRLTARARMAVARPTHAPDISAAEKINGGIKTICPQICFNGAALRAWFCRGFVAAAHAFAAQKIKTDGRFAEMRIFSFNL